MYAIAARKNLTPFPIDDEKRLKISSMTDLIWQRAEIAIFFQRNERATYPLLTQTRLTISAKYGGISKLQNLY
jgi:hypothetical protein